MTTAYSDKEIIKKIKNGEIDYFAFLVKKYTNLIYRYIKGKIFNKDEIEDLVQKTFINFYKAINRFDENRPVLPYLYQIAANEIKMFFRSQKETISLNPEIYIPDDHLKNNHFDLRYKNQLKQLSRDQRQVMEFLIEGFSYQEIADKIKKPVNTVKSIIRRARLKLLSKSR